MNFFYMIKQGFKGTFKNKTMSTLSVMSVSAILIILGVVMSIVTNINEFIKVTEKEINEVKVLIQSDLTEEERNLINESILGIEGVTKSEFTSKEDAFKTLQESWQEDAHLLSGLENPLDDYFVATVEDYAKVEAIESKLLEIEKVKEVNYHQDVMENFVTVSVNVTKFGAVIMLFLLLVCLVLISNTIRGKVHSKKEEIEIIKYVGGSNSFIIAPFIVEGFLIGSIGAILSIVTCIGIYNYGIENLSLFNAQIIEKSILPVSQLGLYLVPMLLIIGIGIGVLGSIISVKRYVRV